MTRAYDADVAIIGYGPSGVIAANTLGIHGISTLVLERDKDIYPRARAVTVNDWTMRIFQALGLDEPVLKVVDVMRALRWYTYDGHEIMRQDFPPSTLGTQGGARFYSIYQPTMEAELRKGAERFAATSSVRYGSEVLGVEQDEHGVTITSKDLGTGEIGTSYTRYVLACDGGSSPTRHSLGVRMLGDTIDTEWVVIDTHVKRWWPDRNLLTFWSDKKRPVVDISLAGGNHRWEIPLHPHETQADFSTHEQIWPMLEAMGITTDDVEIHQHAFYKHHLRSAEKWRVDRVFLVGDAAHLMPPWAGSGMQSGIRDAYDIGWKLACVLQGRLPEAFLDTYEAERRPNVEFYTALSDELGKIIKQEFSDEELAAITAGPPEGAPPADPPLIAPPVLAAGWLNGPLGDDSIIGRMVPQPRVADPRGVLGRLDDLLGDDFVLLGDGVDPRTVLSPEQKAGWDALGARYLTVRPVDQGTTHADEIVDLEGVLGTWMRGFGARVIAVRPDRFVAACDRYSLAAPELVTSALPSPARTIAGSH